MVHLQDLTQHGVGKFGHEREEMTRIESTNTLTGWGIWETLTTCEISWWNERNDGFLLSSFEHDMFTKK